MNAYLLVSVISTLFTIASSLECYVCNDCQPNFINTVTGQDVEECQDVLLFEARCVKEFDTEGVVNRRCGTTGDCAAELLNKCNEEADAFCLTCCEDDKCNGAINIQTSAFVILIVAMLHKFLF